MRLLPCMMDGAYFPLRKGYLPSRAATSSRKITHRDGALRSRSGTPFRHLGSSGHMRLHMRSQLSARAGSPIRKYCTLLDCPTYSTTCIVICEQQRSVASRFRQGDLGPGGKSGFEVGVTLLFCFNFQRSREPYPRVPFPNNRFPPPPSAT